VLDLGYLGIEKNFPELLSSLPCKGKRKCDLSTGEKEYNKSHSKKRYVIEHAICTLKNIRSLQMYLEID